MRLDCLRVSSTSIIAHVASEITSFFFPLKKVSQACREGELVVTSKWQRTIPTRITDIDRGMLTSVVVGIAFSVSKVL